jgi:hypothetical protein
MEAVAELEADVACKDAELANQPAPERSCMAREDLTCPDQCAGR